MNNKLAKKSNLGDLSYSDLGLDVRFQYLEAPYDKDGKKMLFKIDDIDQYCVNNLYDPQFADCSCIIAIRQNGTAFLNWNIKSKVDVLGAEVKVNPDNYKEIGDILFEMAMDTYGHYFAGIVVLVEVEPNTYKMIEK